MQTYLAQLVMFQSGFQDCKEVSIEQDRVRQLQPRHLPRHHWRQPWSLSWSLSSPTCSDPSSTRRESWKTGKRVEGVVRCSQLLLGENVSDVPNQLSLFELPT